MVAERTAFGIAKWAGSAIATPILFAKGLVMSRERLRFSYNDFNFPEPYVYVLKKILRCIDSYV
jgi:hypothetical protein